MIDALGWLMVALLVYLAVALVASGMLVAFLVVARWWYRR